MDLEKPFDRRLRRLRRDRAAGRIAEADYLHRLAAEELLDRLSMVTRSFGNALIMGAAGRSLAKAIGSRGIAVTEADPGFAFATRAGGVQCDEDRLPFADGSFDLILSLGLLDSVNDLPGALALTRRMLRPDGLFLAAFVGAGSLPRLRRALLAADEAESGAAVARIHPQIDLRAAGDLLTRVGLALPVADSIPVEVRYSGLGRLVADLRAMGATNVLAGARRPVSRIGLAAAIADFAADADPDGKTVERFELICLTAWAPSHDQPKPARRGSGTMSLASALKPPSR